MPSRREVDAFRLAQGAVSAAARGHLASFWAGLDVWDVARVRDALEQFFPALVADYGDAAATLAADWFEQVVGKRAVMGGAVSEARANAAMRWALGSILNGNPAGALARLGGIVDRYVKQPGRDTIRASSAAAGIGYARVPSGSETCAFCLMLASRGAVYESKQSALRKSNGAKYHADCVVVGTVVSGPRAVAAYGRHYEGEVVTLTVASGKQLTVTPNHPILTRRGWRAAQLVDVEDELFDAGSRDRCAVGVPDEYEVPARVEDFVRTMAMPVGALACGVPGSAEQFHGDGFDSEVDVVSRYELFRNVRNAELAEIPAQHFLTIGAADVSLPRQTLLRSGAPIPGFDGCGSPSCSEVRGPRLGLPFLDGHPRGTKSAGFGPSANANIGLAEHPSNRNSFDSAGLRERVFTFSGEVPGDEIARRFEAVVGTARVVAVGRHGYSGRVFNLTTKDGWYSANGIVTHNCDCVATPIRDPGDLPDGYDPDALYDRYNAARTAAGSGDPTEILAELRAQQGTH